MRAFERPAANPRQPGSFRLRLPLPAQSKLTISTQLAPLRDNKGLHMQSDERELRQLVATWLAASKARDVETVLSLMADDVVFLVPGQPVMRKAEFAAAARAQSSQDAPRFDGTSEIQEIKILGDWAFMWTKLTVVVTPPGGAQTMTRAGHTLSIFEKQSGKWVLARDANMLAPVPDK